MGLVHFLLGDAIGEGGKAFVLSGEPERQIKPGLTHWDKWFSLARYRFHLPGMLQEWQRAQASTVIYDHPIRLTVAVKPHARTSAVPAKN